MLNIAKLKNNEIKLQENLISHKTAANK